MLTPSTGERTFLPLTTPEMLTVCERNAAATLTTRVALNPSLAARRRLARLTRDARAAGLEAQRAGRWWMLRRPPVVFLTGTAPRLASVIAAANRPR